MRVADWSPAGDDSDSAKVEREVYREFERQHPGVEIQREGTPGGQDYVKKILLGFIAKSEPDVIRLDASSAAVFVDGGVVRDVRPLAARDGFDLDQFYPNTLSVAERGDKLYALPVDFTPVVMYYNRKLFDAAGVPYPHEGWTWDEFLDDAKKLTVGDRYGYAFTNWMAGWILWLWTNGCDVFDANHHALPAVTDTLTVGSITFIRDLVDRYKVAPSLSQQAAQGVEPFANGDAAMELSGHWNLVTLSHSPKIDLKDIGIAPVPMARAGMKPVTVLYESGWAIGSHSKKADLAWEFIKYFTSAEVQRKIQAGGIGVCARKDVAQERATTEREREFLRIVPSGRNPWGATVVGYDFVEDEGMRMMDSVLKSGRAPSEALKAFGATVDKELSKQ